VRHDVSDRGSSERCTNEGAMQSDG
jgi:hypothetical protein